MAKTANKRKEIAAVTDDKAQEGQKEDTVAGTTAETLVPEQEEEAAIDGIDRAKEEAEVKEQQEAEEQQETEEGAMDEEACVQNLVARTYILYNSQQYKPGDFLPANNPDMVAAWLAAGTAAWSRASVKSVKASPSVALPGLAGAISGTMQMSGLAGRVH